MESMSFDDVQAGQRWVSQGRTVTQADVSQFACLTGDFNPLHVDYDFAAQSPYRKPIAHGLLGLSWVAGLGSTAPLMQTVAFTAVKSWEFLAPIYFGDTVHVETVCLKKLNRGRKAGQVVWSRKLINQKGQTVQQGQFETLVAIGNDSEDPVNDVEDVVKRVDGESSTAKPNFLKSDSVTDCATEKLSGG